MFTKQLVMSGLLLISGAAQISAMQLEASEADMQQSAKEYEVVAPVATDDMEMPVSVPTSKDAVAEDISVVTDSMSAAVEQPAPKKTTISLAPEVAEEMAVSVGETAAPMEMPSEVAAEDKGDNQGQTDVQGVFESMSREEEDGESFPG